MSSICVSNDSAEALAAALNQALAIVVTPENIERILTHKSITHEYQYVHPAEGSSIGCVYMLTIGKRESFSISVSIGISMNGSNPQPACVRALAKRGCLRYKVARSLTRVDFSYDEGSGQYVATTEIPSRLWRVLSEISIELK